MRLRVFVMAAVIAVVAGAAPAGAQSVKVEFNAGLVSVSAQNAPLRLILAEWARLGGATIVNGDGLSGPPLTLELTSVTERQALDTLLRSAAGYMLAPRRAGTSGVSAFDRILILPTSVGPRNNPSAPAPAVAGQRPLPLPQRLPPVMPQPGAAVDDIAPEVQDAPEPEPAVTPVQPAPAAPRPLIPTPIRPMPQPTEEAAPQPAADDTPATPQPGQGNPFGLPPGSSTFPGIIAPSARPAPAPQGR